MQTCNNCGHLEKDDSSLFCQNCGNTLRETSNQVIKSKISFINQRVVKKSVINGKTIVAGLGIAFLLVSMVIAGLFFAFYNNSFTYTKIGERSYSGPIEGMNDLSFDFSNSIGNYVFNTVNGLVAGFTISQEVYSTNSNAQLSDSAEVLLNNDTGSIFITFNSNQNSIRPQFKYDFIISIDSGITLKNINLETQTGNIDSIFESQTVYSSKIFSNTGHVFTSFRDCSFMAGLTGIGTSTGSIQFELQNPSFHSNRTWDIGTLTGSITTNIQISIISNHDQKFDIHTSTGSINLNRSYENDPFETLTATVSTGSISFNSINQVGKTFYNSNENTDSPLSLNFNLETSTGDIVIN